MIRPSYQEARAKYVKQRAIDNAKLKGWKRRARRLRALMSKMTRKGTKQ